MRAKTQWTPGGIVLWLIAAILATLVVCSQASREAPRPAKLEGTEIQLDIVE